MISIDFASRNYRLQYRVRASLIAGCVILAIIMTGMLWKAVSLRTSISIVEQGLKERQATLDRDRPLLAERAQLVKDLSAMSGITGSRKFSWTKLLTSIETAVPAGVALKSVNFNQENSLLTLEGAAHSPESLRNLVIALEKSSLFREPLLKQQTLEKGSISFNVVAIYRQ
jgi:Tfp pilus assembly protein PilN